MASWYRYQDEDLILTLHVQPGAKRSEIAGLHGDALKIRLAAPPVEGKANVALLRFMAKCLQVAQRDVELIQGAQSRHKLVRVRNTQISPRSLLDSSQDS